MNVRMERMIPIALFLISSAAIAVPVPLLVERVPALRTEVMLDGKDRVLFADFGKDAYGNLELRFDGMVPAGPLVVRLGEKLDVSGAVDRNPPGSVNFREIILNPAPDARTVRLTIPRKPRHDDPAAVPVRPETGEITPFRYAEIVGDGIDPSSVAVTQLAVHAPFDDSLSSFSSSDPSLDAVWDLCKHTMKATTACGVFIDGERERIPYEGDAYINQLSFAACDPDPRLIRATFDRLMEHPTWPTEWLLHMPMIAAEDYMATGDPAIARTHFAALKKRLLALKTRKDGLLVASAIVDWPACERDGYNGGEIAEDNPKQAGPMVNTVANAFYIHALGKMALLAEALGKSEDGRKFSSMSRTARDSFNRVFLDPSTGLYTDGEGSRHFSLHANMFPLAFGLVPPERIPGVAAFVKSRGMACSVYGAQYLLEALMAAGMDREAVALMVSNGTRSWRHMIDVGSTMTWEAWDPSVKPNLTWNHAWGAAPANIISRHLLGVRPLEPGCAKVLIAPRPGDLSSVKGRVPTRRGGVDVDFQQVGGIRRLSVVVPAGMRARLSLPPRHAPARSLTLDGKSIAPDAAGKEEAEVGSGHHVLESSPVTEP